MLSHDLALIRACAARLALLEAAVGAARTERNKAMSQARDNGHTLDAIAEAAGTSIPLVWRTTKESNQ